MSEGAAIQIVHNFEVIHCYKCRMPFAVPAPIRRDWVNTGQDFYCPNGHVQHYTESEMQRLKKEVERQKKLREWAEQRARNESNRADRTERRRRAEKAAKTRLQRRVAAGVCPCCRRTFQDLARHMNTKHPGYGQEPQQAEANDGAE